MRSTSAFLLLVVSASVTDAQWLQQGNKLVGADAVGNARQGVSVSISSDGNTAIVGGQYDEYFGGSAWVFTRTGGVWSQQGNKLWGTGAAGYARQGTSVAISSDGNAAIIGGYYDSSLVGAAWVFTRTLGVWSQQGKKLVGTYAYDASYQGLAVDISSHGNTAIVGGPYDHSRAGAVWVFTRTGGEWAQQGPKLTGAGGGERFGTAVAISSDGNTAIVGAPFSMSDRGGAYAFVRVGTVWIQQGGILVGTGAIGGAYQGTSVSISSDGNTALVGGPYDNGRAGAVWLYTRTGGVWTQQGPKLVGTGAAGIAQQGWSASLSGDGNIAIVGGPIDDDSVGAAWVFTRTAGVWSQVGGKLVGTGVVGIAWHGQSVSISTDGSTAIVGGLRDNDQAGAAWVYTGNTSSVVFPRSGLALPILDNLQTTDEVTLNAEDIGGAHALQRGSSSGVGIETYRAPSSTGTRVTDVTVLLDSVFHTAVGELEFTLTHAGITDTLMFHAGGTGDDIIGAVLTDQASVPIGSSSAPFTGVYLPFSPLGTFAGLDPIGTWVLRVFDNASGNTGILQQWSLKLTYEIVSGVEAGIVLPDRFVLEQNFPNPFNPATAIEFSLPRRSHTLLTVNNLLGENVATLVSEERAEGRHRAVWDGRHFPSGVYFYRLTAGQYVETKKMLLVK